MHRRTGILVAGALLLWSGGAAAQDTRVAPSVAVSGAFPGDVIRLTIYREPELSQVLQVPPDGIVVFPKIGAMPVTGRSIEDMQQAVVAEFQKYLRNPSIRIDVLRKVQVTGAVKNPNIYSLDATVTLSDAIAVAGGVTPTGRNDRVELRRDGEIVQVLLLEQRMSLADSPIRSGDQLFVPERSYLSRNGNTLAAVLSAGLGVIVALIAR